METIIYILDLFGIAVFAITGSLAAGKKQMDIFGVVVLAVVTAIGGGTIRDLIIGDSPVFWISCPFYLLVAVIAGIATFFLVRFYNFSPKLLLIADAFGLAIFTVIGTEKALAFGIPPSIAVIMGIMTGVAGGIIRDILSGEIPLILRREIYATASLCGAIVFLAMITVFQNDFYAIAVLASIITTFGLRLFAIKKSISLPIFISRDNKMP